MATRVPAGGRRAAKKIDPAPNPRPGVGPHHNKPPKDDLDEAERVQLISFTSRIGGALAEVERAKGPYDAAKKGVNQLFSLAKAADPTWTRKYLERRMEEMNTPTRDMAIEVARETKHRRWLGIIRPEDEQQSLLGAGPQEPRDEFHWRGEGYKAGLRQAERSAPKECPERHVQAFLQEYDRGLEVVLHANAPKKAPPTVAETAAADFKTDNPEIDVEAAARKLKKDAAFMDRTAPPEVVDPDPLGVNGPDDGFEATAEELAAQAGRREADEVVV